MVFPGSVFFKEQVEKFGDAGEDAGAFGSEDVEADGGGARGEGAGEKEAGQIAGVIDVEMGEQNGVDAVEVEIEFADTEECTGSGVDENARCAVDFDDVAGAGAAEGTGSAGSQDDEGERAGEGCRLEG